MGNRKSAAYMLTEKEIRYAIANSTSVSSAARFLNVTHGTFVKYAQMFFDGSSGKSLLDLAKSKTGKRVVKIRWKKWLISAHDVIEGKYPTMSPLRAKEKFINDGIFPDECGRCGHHKQREADNTVGTVFCFKNGISSDFSLENVELLCWNCYYLYYGNVRQCPEVRRNTRETINAADLAEVKSFVQEGLYRNSNKTHTTENSEKLKDEFDDYMANLSDEEYERLFGHERPD